MRYLPFRVVLITVIVAGTFGPSPSAAPAQDAAADVSLQARLDRLATEMDEAREDQRVPGLALAVVKDGEVVFARGFGLADVENGRPVTPETPFFIGSTTKAFTATLVGMLVDDGVIGWDDAVEQHLPYFSLDVQSEDAAAQATLRDLLSHRTGFPRMGPLWAGGALSSEEILRQASGAEPFAPFRERFHYSNVQYLAAGWAAAEAGGASWDDLVADRILTPLEMTDTRTSMKAARADERLARGYRWDEITERFVIEESGPAAAVDSVAPAGAISSTADDLTRWVQFLLADGVDDGERLISREALTTTWTPQITIADAVDYGMGWFVRDWRGQPFVEHGGNVPGFTAEIGLLPESDLGFVLLANVQSSTLRAFAINQVPDILLGAPPAPETEPMEAGDLEPYLGRYVANFASFSNEVFTILDQDGGLALNIPSQTTYALNPPNADGRWPFALTDQIAVSFTRDDAGTVVALNMHQAGLTFEVPREGLTDESEDEPEALQKYLGTYRNDEENVELTVLVRNQRLAVRMPNGSVGELDPPDDVGRWASRDNPQLAFVFDEGDDGAVVALNVHRPGGAPVVHLTRAAGSTLPTVGELMALRGIDREAASVPETMRLTGRVRFPNAAVDGRFETTVAGDDRLRTDVDLGRLGLVQVAVNGDRGWRDSTFDGTSWMELAGGVLRQTRLSHPGVVFGDWREYYDAVRITGTGPYNGRRIYRVELEASGVPTTTVAVDAETGDILVMQVNRLLPGGLGALPTTTTYEDYREVDGIRIPFRSVETNQEIGRTIMEIDEIETNVTVDPEMFVLEPGGAGSSGGEDRSFGPEGGDQVRTRHPA